ncbi:Hypothetical predicted protein [Olea europaea subsp. europaea]|uniref:Uncharacterized protein n=1 Tax=Olea europaea subsp. europaea TaxID=158383 RepID=A0A8S0TL25_OLEEU|nr:Hypothetical predicted protein [Olea europaea subsp. europaea]
MGDVSPTTTDESVETSGEIPTSTEFAPVISSPTTRNLPPGYRSLRDAISSGTPFTSSFWSPLTFPTMEPFTAQGRGPSVTSITTARTVCVASSTPVSSRPTTSLFGIFEPTTNVPTEGPYDRYYLSQPIFEVSVPMSIEWGSTSFHCGQVLSAQSPRRPPQDHQGKSFHGNPFTLGGPFFQPSSNPGQTAVQPTQPKIQQGFPTGQAAQPYGQPTVQYNQFSGQFDQPQVQSIQLIAQPTRPSVPSGQPSVAQPQPKPQQAQPSGQSGQFQYPQGYPSGQTTQPTGHPFGSDQPSFLPQTGPQPRPQAPSGLQMQGAVQPQPSYQPLPVTQAQFGLQSPYGHHQPQGQPLFTPYQNYQQP